MSNPDVLVIDDDTDIRESIAHLLEYEGYKMITACNGADGLRQLSFTRPSVILLDMMMPIMDGWQFKAAFDERPDLAGIPIVVVSADGNIAEKSMSIGVSEYLSKPIQIDRLLELVKKYCSPIPASQIPASQIPAPDANTTWSNLRRTLE